MNFKTIMNLGMLAGVITLASCGESTNVDKPTEINTLAELEDQAFQQEVNEEEVRLENYIKELSTKIESADVEDIEGLEATKKEAINLLLELRADYVQLNDATAAKWLVFQEGVNSLIQQADTEINYAKDMDEDSSDS